MGYWEEFKSWYSWKNEFDSGRILCVVVWVLLMEATGLSVLSREGSSQFYAIAFLFKSTFIFALWQIFKVVGVALVVALPSKFKGGKL